MLKRVFASAFALSVATLAPAAQAAEIVLPPPVTSGPNLNALQYGDFTVYSLAYLNYITSGSTSGNFTVNSDTGDNDIQNLIVVATGDTSSTVTGNSAGMDNAYALSSWSSNFTTYGTSDPTGDTFAGDNSRTWDAGITALKSFLGGDDLVFFFSMEENNGSASNILSYAKVTVYDGSGVSQGDFELTSTDFPGLGTTSYDFDGPGGQGAVAPAYMHGSVCVDNTNKVLYYQGSCTQAISSYNSGNPFNLPNPSGLDLDTVSQNLGNDVAAFAITSNELNDVLRNLTSGWLSVDLRLGALSGGYEQVFIGRAPNLDVPEPAALGLLGLGLGAMALRRRKR